MEHHALGHLRLNYGTGRLRCQSCDNILLQGRCPLAISMSDGNDILLFHPRFSHMDKRLSNTYASLHSWDGCCDFTWLLEQVNYFFAWGIQRYDD